MDVLFNTTGTVIVTSTGSLLSKVISNSSLANLTSNNSTSIDGSVNLSTTWNTSRDLAFNSTNNIDWTAMYTFKECSTSITFPNMKQTCEKARKPVTCTTKTNIYSKTFLMLDLLLILAIGVYNIEVFVGAGHLGDLICNRPYSNENALSARTERIGYRALLSTHYGTAAYWL